MSDALLPADFALAVLTPADRSPAAVYLASRLFHQGAPGYRRAVSSVGPSTHFPDGSL